MEACESLFQQMGYHEVKMRESEEAVGFVKVLKTWFCYQRPVIDLINHQHHIADQKVESNSNQNQLACKEVSCKI
jgi:hypothetical protein